jgi:hypothetical protein
MHTIIESWMSTAFQIIRDAIRVRSTFALYFVPGPAPCGEHARRTGHPLINPYANDATEVRRYLRTSSSLSTLSTHVRWALSNTVWLAIHIPIKHSYLSEHNITCKTFLSRHLPVPVANMAQPTPARPSDPLDVLQSMINAVVSRSAQISHKLADFLEAYRNWESIEGCE